MCNSPKPTAKNNAKQQEYYPTNEENGEWEPAAKTEDTYSDDEDYGPQPTSFGFSRNKSCDDAAPGSRALQLDDDTNIYTYSEIQGRSQARSSAPSMLLHSSITASSKSDSSDSEKKVTPGVVQVQYAPGLNRTMPHRGNAYVYLINQQGNGCRSSFDATELTGRRLSPDSVTDVEVVDTPRRRGSTGAIDRRRSSLGKNADEKLSKGDRRARRKQIRNVLAQDNIGNIGADLTDMHIASRRGSNGSSGGARRGSIGSSSKSGGTRRFSTGSSKKSGSSNKKSDNQDEQSDAKPVRRSLLGNLLRK